MDAWDAFGATLIIVGLCLYFLDIEIDIDVDVDYMTGFDAVGILGGLCIISGIILISGNPALSLLAFVIVSIVVGVRWTVRYRAFKSIVPYETISHRVIGQTGYTKSALTPRGLVQLKTELWNASSDSGEHIPEGVDVMVVDIDGNTILVFQVQQSGELD